MDNEFKNAPETGRGGSGSPEKPMETLSHHTYPAATPGADAAQILKPILSKHQRTNPPARAGDDARRQTIPVGALHHPEHPPETPGTRANADEKPIEAVRASEHPAHGPGDDAIKGQKPIMEEHHRNLPPQGGVEVHRAMEARFYQDLREAPPGIGGGDAPKKPSEPRSAIASPTKSPGNGGRSVQFADDAHTCGDRPNKSRRKAGQIDGDHDSVDAHNVQDATDLRFTDPLVAEIVALHRMRRRWMKAKNALILQGKAFGRAVCDGDKEAGTAAFERVFIGKTQPGDETLAVAIAPFAAAIARFDEDIRPIERQLAKLAKRLPIAEWVESVPGLGFGSVAAIVGEAGDLSAYPSVAGVWKRMGLAVIDGDGRQRRVADAERALAHGYNPERRSVVWVMADSMSKLQRTWLDKETGEVKKPAGAYGLILEAEKERALAAGISKAHAEARGKRHMSKAVLRDMTLAWRRAVGQRAREIQRMGADRPQFVEAAE